VVNLHQTVPDSPGLFWQVAGSPSDGDRQWRTDLQCMARKRSGVRIPIAPLRDVFPAQGPDDWPGRESLHISQMLAPICLLCCFCRSQACRSRIVSGCVVGKRLPNRLRLLLYVLAAQNRPMRASGTRRLLRLTAGSQTGNTPSSVPDAGCHGKHVMNADARCITGPKSRYVAACADIGSFMITCAGRPGRLVLARSAAPAVPCMAELLTPYGSAEHRYS
jgi:hypothetical protein